MTLSIPKPSFPPRVHPTILPSRSAPSLPLLLADKGMLLATIEMSR
jgi:hypothetical protein